MLYNLTAGENIRMGNIDEKDPSVRIKTSAETTGVHELIRNLPDGYETAIGNLFDDSRELSWGEWQKIALARALFRDAPILILDEPSSALDADTEYDIFSKFRGIVKGRTSILISHRFTNVSLADRIIVLDKGSVAESGTHDELMKRGGIYSSMFTKQSSRFNK
jgi:ATP-binding cassette subfamily B protein